MSEDNWKHRSAGMVCDTCIWFVKKEKLETAVHVSVSECEDVQLQDKFLGRCRRHCPSMNGFVPVFSSDWCGDHRLDEDKL